MNNDNEEEFERTQCPECGKEFEAARENKWESGGLTCPFCGAEIEG